MGIDNFKKIITTLEKEEISTKNIFTSDFKNDESIVVVNEKGDNYIISSIKNLCSMDLNFSNNMLKKIKGGDSLLLQGNVKKEITLPVIEITKEVDPPVVESNESEFKSGYRNTSNY